MKKAILMILLVFVIILLGIITYENPNIEPELLPIPENIVLEVDETLLEDTSIAEEDSLYDVTIPDAYAEDESKFYDKYYTEGNLFGDATGYYIQESNYPQLNTFKTTKEKRTYDSTINIDVGLLNSIYMSEESTTLAEHVTYQNNKLPEILEHYSKISQNKILDQKCYYKINGMMIVTNDERKPKKIKITINDSKPQTVTLNNTDKYQLIDLNYTQDNIAKPVSIKIDIISSYNNTVNPDDPHLYIEDVTFGIESNLPQGI